MSTSFRAVKQGCMLLLALGLTSGGSAALASPVMYQFTGVVDSTDGFAGVKVGDPITGSFLYDTSLSGTATPGSGTSYLGDVGLQFHAGTQTLEILSPAFSGINVQHLSANISGQSATGDAVVLGVAGAVDPNTQTADSLAFGLGDASGKALANESLPTSLDLSKFGTTAIVAQIGNASLFGTVETLTLAPTPTPQLVPEPATLSVFLLGIGGGIAARTSLRAARKSRLEEGTEG